MSLHFYNTLTRQLEPFVSIKPNIVKMYVCGMTVYDLCHLGHARSMVNFDVIYRWLIASGWKVTFVRNITDIDDKIIARAQQNNETIRNLTDRMIEALQQDSAALGILPPSLEPRATDYIAQMQKLIANLQQNGLAYQAEQGDMLYSVRKFQDYGKLSNKSIDELHSGQRVAVAQDKQDPLDFVLWKQAKPDEPNDAKWDSPFGCGRPGWHIECSAMSNAILGEQFDIHGGGADLQFPHHENEIAQSQGVSGKIPARYWLHNGFVRVNDEKMSKSLENFFTIREVLQQYDAETVRFFIIRAHYRHGLNYGDEHLNDAKNSLRRLYTSLDLVPTSQTLPSIDWENPFAKRFKIAMDNDIGTPEAIAILFELTGEINRSKSQALANLLKSLGGCLGILQQTPKVFLQSGATLASTEIEAKIIERQQAKQEKNYALADSIRKKLLEQGVVLKDNPSGTNWEVVK